jgi:hypothetical protein
MSRECTCLLVIPMQILRNKEYPETKLLLESGSNEAILPDSESELKKTQ